MAVRSSIVTVTGTPTLLSVGADQDSNPGYRDIAIQNISTSTVYLGGPEVAAAIGFPIKAGVSLTLNNVMPDSLLYAVVDAEAAEVAVLQVGI